MKEKLQRKFTLPLMVKEKRYQKDALCKEKKDLEVEKRKAPGDFIPISI